VVTIPTTGTVEHIEVSGTSILWSVDEPISPDMPDNTVGMVYLLNTQDMSSIAIKVRWLCMSCVWTVPLFIMASCSAQRNSRTRTLSERFVAFPSPCWTA
jgi:hypothetical protein